ncbi:hypothetical protein CSA56_02415 [candidate division KSB3 bacterium]|uniref:SPOR domain-containing protein n=1 Tax=candidate division KSB3 bacterium TaxID=2044937 RepID=A0A2G6KJT2_9BACT|nr:MAG: hypothetical protein CSA56_02415 [candidate division KSB3 bacterium]
MQRRSSVLCGLSIVLCCLVLALNVSANTGSISGLSEWDVTSFKVDLLSHQGANGDIQTDQNDWIHLGANHLEGGDITYRIRTGYLTQADILEVWIDGFSTSNDLDIGPTVFIGTGKNRFEQISRMSGDAWRPFVFRFADDSLYGDVTDPSNRNENWRIRYPSSKYEVRRIDKGPNALLDGQTLPVRISITGAEDFIIKRMEVVVFRAGGGYGRFSIASLSPYKVYRGDRLTLNFTQSFPENDIDLYVTDTAGKEHRIRPQGMSTDRKQVWFYVEGSPFTKSGEYRVRMVDRSGSRAIKEVPSKRFEYVHPKKVVRPKPVPIPKPVVSACTPPCTPTSLPPIPSAPPSYIVPVMPQNPGIGMPPTVAGPPITSPVMTAPAVTMAPPAMSAGRYTIQIGAFRAESSAVVVMNKLRGYGFHAYISTAVQGTAQVFRVRVGQYASKAHANQDAARLRQNGYETWVTTTS